MLANTADHLMYMGPPNLHAVGFNVPDLFVLRRDKRRPEVSGSSFLPSLPSEHVYGETGRNT